MTSYFNPRKGLYWIIVVGFSISLGGWIIYQGGIFHVLLGSVIAFGAVLAFIGVVVALLRQARRNGVD